jgi:hypothetical protein
VVTYGQPGDPPPGHPDAHDYEQKDIDLHLITRCPWSILLTCRQIHNEALPVLYAATKFKLELYRIHNATTRSVPRPWVGYISAKESEARGLITYVPPAAPVRFDLVRDVNVYVHTNIGRRWGITLGAAPTTEVLAHMLALLHNGEHLKGAMLSVCPILRHQIGSLHDYAMAGFEIRAILNDFNTSQEEMVEAMENLEEMRRAHVEEKGFRDKKDYRVEEEWYNDGGSLVFRWDWDPDDEWDTDTDSESESDG